MVVILMISYIKGTLEYINENSIIIESNNIGYEISIPLSGITRLPSLGESVKVHTYLYVREDAMQLYGFITRDDLDIFKNLITVNGIGPKGALGILSSVTPDELRLAIISDDVKTISKAPGIGKKTAQKLILDLKDKIKLNEYTDAISTEIQLSNTDKASSTRNDAIEALVSLGYSNSEAVNVIKTIEITDVTTVEEILKSALRKLVVL